MEYSYNKDDKIVAVCCFNIAMYINTMAIRLKQGSEEISITLTNGHCEFIENMRKRYGFSNQAQALDFVLKAVGETDDKVEKLMVGGIEYTPEGYDEQGR